MKNEHASNGIAEELIRAIAQFGAMEVHLKTNIEKINAELENGLVDISTDPEEINRQLKKIEEFKQDLIETAELRRRAMYKLYSMFDGGDKDMWCMVKHSLLANMLIFESWQASDDDPELFDMWIESNKQSVKAITRFLGEEVTSCASCMADFLKGAEA